LKALPQSFLGTLLWASAVGWAAAIWTLSSRPADELSSPLFDIPHGDKVAHMVAFAVGGFLLVSALRVTTGWKWRRLLWLSVSAVAAFGMIDEWHQLSTPGRSGADVFDWLADFAGAMVGAFSARPIHGRIRHLAGLRPHPAPAPGD
jgi:VanZ family protein